MEKKMFYKSQPWIYANAKELRNHLTHAEMILWGYLKQKPYGFRFRRQHPINDFVADFFCYKLKLVIEVDGGIREKPEIKETDLERENWLTDHGLAILRFTNYEIERGLEKVVLTIENKILLLTTVLS